MPTNYEPLVLTIEPTYIGSAVSPTVDITETSDDVTVTITDFRGEHSYTVEKTDQAIADAQAAASAANSAASAASTAATRANTSADNADSATTAANSAAAAATQATVDTEAATAAANSAASSATSAAANANAAAGRVDTAIDDAESAATAASSAATSATNAASAANTAASNAGSKAALANTAAANADAKAGLADSAATAANSAASTATAAASTASSNAAAAASAASQANSAATAANSAAEAANDATEDTEAATAAALAAIEAMGDISELAVPEMSASIRGGAKLGVGLDVSDGRLNIDLSDSGSGASVLTNGCAFLDVEGDGWAEQDTTTGKNLAYVETLSSDSTGLINTDIATIAAGEYTFSATGIETVALSIRSNPGNVYITGINLTAGNRNQITFSVNAEATIRIYKGGLTANTTYVNDIQLEAGSTATAYEPYTGGKPSPSPDYPQEVRVAKGRNLINPANASSDVTYNNNSYTNTVTDALTEGKIIIRAYTQDASYTTIANVNTTGQYVFTFTTAANFSYLRIYHNGSSRNIEFFQRIDTLNKGKSYSISFDLVSNNASVVGGVVISNLQLELGSTATPYVPYGHVGLEIKQGSTLVDCIPVPIPADGPAALPDGTHDTLAIDSAGHVVLEKNIEYGELNGTENWIAYAEWNSSTQYCYYLGKQTIWNRDSTKQLILCSALNGISRTTFANSKPDNSVALTGITEISTRSQYATLNEFKQYLAANPMKYIALKREAETIDLGYIDLPTIPDGCTVSIPELHNIGVEWLVTGADGVPEMALDERKRTLYEIALASDAALSNVAPIENGRASTNYAVDSYLVHGGTLYRVTTAIATGETINPGSNVTATTVMAEIIRLTA